MHSVQGTILDVELTIYHVQRDIKGFYQLVSNTIAPFPGLARSSFAVQNLRRRPAWSINHVMRATAVTPHQVRATALSPYCTGNAVGKT